MKAMMLLLLLTLHPAHAGLAVPRSLSLDPDFSSQTLCVTWASDSALFDVEIFLTELMEMVLKETVSAVVDPVSGRCSWTWHSEVPLQCTSHSVQVRAREGSRVSEWSPLQTIMGSDVPDKPGADVFPQDKVVPVGSSVTFCCIVSESQQFGSFQYRHQKLEETRLSRRSFATTVTNLPRSDTTGTNIICSSKLNTILSGAVVFVGYPPGDEGLECETRDLQKAECTWRKGRDTGFWKRSFLTRYTLNGRICEARREVKQCRFDHWENSWTLTAVNPLGVIQLNDSAHITDRVRLLAPVNMSAVPQSWTCSVEWVWTVPTYRTLDMVCQVEVSTGGRSDPVTARNFTGVGLSSVLLDGLRPDGQYSVSVRCASRLSLWRWGDWSAPYSIHTEMDRPEAPDMWVWLDSESTGQILWKPLSLSDSHGALLGYDVYQKDGEEEWKTLSLPPSASNLSLTLSNSSGDVIVAVAARNPAGLSQRSVVVVPEFRAGSLQPRSELVGRNGHLEVTWQPWPSASRGYLVEWVPEGCSDHCSVQWMKVPGPNSSAIIQPGSLLPGVQYTLSVYALSKEATVFLQRNQVYGEEQVPGLSVMALSAKQSGQNVLLSWKPAAVSEQRGIIRGFSIYLTKASRLELTANLTDPEARSYTVQGLSLGSYKFTVKAYTSAGEGGGATVSIKVESDSDLLVVQILAALGGMSCFLVIISVFCYRRRDWVKKAFYPEVPEPKLAGDWSAPPAPLDVKPPAPSVALIIESPEPVRKGLFPVLEEESYDGGSIDGSVEADMDSDEPTLLRYYNQLVTDGSHSNHASDTSGSSTSSMDSTQTQVTYTGIQSPASSHWAPGYRPQMQPAEGEEEPAARSQSEARGESPSGGYKPQCSWQVDSPEAENFSGSLGSPTSITSSQFLIPETAEDPEHSGTWFQNLLSGKF